MEGEHANEEGAPTIKMTKNLLEFLRQVTNVSGRIFHFKLGVQPLNIRKFKMIEPKDNLKNM